MEAKMLQKFGFAGLIGAAMIALPALTAPAAAQATGDPFVKEQALNQWRASKLVGVSVTGPNQEKIGKISDVLLDHDGNAQIIVVSVGGFLGIGAKDVGVPFKTMQWRTEGRTVAITGAAPSASTTGDATTARAVKSDPAATEASQGYPDMGMLNMTKAQLQSAPDFKYTPTPTADAGGAAAPGGAAPPPRTTP
jgi:sporulation protein YlmC with PRC-barrel domain